LKEQNFWLDDITRDIVRQDRFQYLLEALERNTRNLSQMPTDSPFAIHEFFKQYRDMVAFRCRYVVPPGFDAVRRVPLRDIYVTPTIAPMDVQATVESPLKLDDFLATLDRAVILGLPGGGKTTLTRYIAIKAGSDGPEPAKGIRRSVALVDLRRYAKRRNDIACSLADYLETQAHAADQISNVPAGAFLHALLSGTLVVIIDGLDEILDTSQRRELIGDIEAHARLYPASPMLVTSRPIGYTEAPLDREIFSTYRLSDFSSYQVQDYAERWFGLANWQFAENVTAFTHSFMEESKQASDLRANPLMLALMCNLYRGEHYIPRNRPELFQKCATMLFSRWDKSRGIESGIDFESHLLPAVGDLAYWMFEHDVDRSGVPEDQVVNRLAHYLGQWRFTSLDEAITAARALAEYCSGRAWVLTEIGLSTDGSRLFQFSHRTFLEYFAAWHLTRIAPSNAALASQLVPRVIRAEWDLVAQLAIQIRHGAMQGAGEELLSIILEAPASREGHLNALAFCARMLRVIVPKPEVVRRITDEVLQSACNEVAETSAPGGEETGPTAVADSGPGWLSPAAGLIALSELTEARMDNCDAVGAAVRDSLLMSDGGASVQKWGLCMSIPDLREYGRNHGATVTDSEYGDGGRRVQEVVGAMRGEAHAIARRSVAVAIPCFDAGLCSLEDVAQWHGGSALSEEYGVAPLGSRGPIVWRAGVLLSKKLGAELNRDLASVWLRSGPPPWLSPGGAKDVARAWETRLASQVTAAGDDPILEWDPRYLLVAAVLWEVLEPVSVARIRGDFRQHMPTEWVALLDLRMQRKKDAEVGLGRARDPGKVYRDSVQAAVLRAEVTAPIMAYLSRWLLDDLTFVANRKSSARETLLPASSAEE